MLERLPLGAYTAGRGLLTRRVEIVCDRISYRLEEVPLKKLLNWIRVEASVLAKPERPWGRPTHMQIEPTNRCNLRCSLCPVTTGMDRPSGFMDFGLYKRLIDEAGEDLFLILLWDWGEPFIHPDIYDMIAYARGKGIKLVSSTNGHLFAREEHAEKVVRSGLDSLIFAMDGISQETYEKFRQGGKLETVLQGIRNVVAQKKALGSRTPLINLRFIPMRHNEHEMGSLRDLARCLGVDALTFKTLNPVNPAETDPKKDSDNPYLPCESRYQRFKYASDGFAARLRVDKNPCKHLWNMPVIHWNGVICSCPYDPKEEYPLGDLNTQSLAEIWDGEPYRRMRRRFREDWQGLPICANCSYAYEGGDCGREIIAEAVFFGSRAA